MNSDIVLSADSYSETLPTEALLMCLYQASS